jgi:S1-C subfamily serine protease
MDDTLLLDAVERYIRGEMNPDERLHFENLRKTNPEVDQLVVEHTLFLQQMNRFGEWKKFRTSLHNIHTDLAEQGKINSARLKGKAKVVYLWKRYKRVVAIAASIAGITAILISALVWTFTPRAPIADVEQLKRTIKAQESRTNKLQQDLNNVKIQINEPPINYTTGGTSFLIDPKGYLVTNAHVVQGARHIAVENRTGESFRAKAVFVDQGRDIAILKIDDNIYKLAGSIPYSINKNSSDLAEPIFTLGYPRNEIVYGQGYLSAKTGYNGDTLSCQIEITANRGNSGSPIFNRNGEVIGILNGRQANTDAFVFAIHSRYIHDAIEKLKKDSSYRLVKLPAASAIRGLDRTQQVKKVQDCVFMVKVN